MARVRRILDLVIGWAVVVIFAVLVVDVLWQIAVRYAPVGLPSRYATFTEELARSLLLWLAIIGAAYAAGHRDHLAIDLVSRRLSARARRMHDAIVQGLVMLFAVVLLVVGGGRLVGLTIDLEQVSASLRIPMGAIYTALPIGGVIMAVYALLNIIEGPPPEPEGAIKTEAEAHAAEGA